MCLSSSFQKICLFMLLLMWVKKAHGDAKVFNVMKFDAIADGKTDNSKAFWNAWRKACEWKGKSKVLIPPGTYNVGPVIFKGPCKGEMIFQMQGVLKAPTDLNVFHTPSWITFQYINGLTIAGGGTLDGQGASAWPYNQCSKNPNCKALPVSLRFDFITKATVRHISLINSKNFHFNILASKNLEITSVKIIAPGDSPNTDGIHIGSSSDVKISRSVIATGDDCISLGSGSKNINVSNVWCGPGHGISIGSLGKFQKEEDVSGIRVFNSTLSGTTNGIRIKTWAPSYPSSVSQITFEDIVMRNVDNPIIIDQQYCPSGSCNPKASSSVQIRDVLLKNIRGLSRSKLAVNLKCSRSFPCQNVLLKDIILVYKGLGGPATSSCSYVHGKSYGKQLPPSCI